MSRSLSSGYTSGSNEANLECDLASNTCPTPQSSGAVCPEANDISGTTSQLRVIEFPHINGPADDGVVAEQKGDTFSSEPKLQIKRTRGGIAGIVDDVAQDKADDNAFNKIPARIQEVSTTAPNQQKQILRRAAKAR